MPSRLHTVGTEPRGHRLDALALARQQQPLAVVFQRLVAVGMPGGAGQAVQISRQAFLLRAWPRRSGRHENFYRKMFCFSPGSNNILERLNEEIKPGRWWCNASECGQLPEVGAGAGGGEA